MGYFFFQAEDGIRDAQESRGLGDVYKRQGIGIADEYIDHIYEAFSQEEAGYTRRFEGTGLGLSLIHI